MITALFLFATATAPQATLHADEIPKDCNNCSTWNVQHKPFKIHGNSYYVGVDGLSSVLITSNKGHIVIDAGLPQSAALIAANIQSLGFQLSDVKWIINSHTHYDHAGGLAALQRLTGAQIAASPESSQALRLGSTLPNDPQAGYGDFMNFPAVTHSIKTIANRDRITLGDVGVTAIFTPGHTPGGTTWTWPSCEAGKCINIVFADSLNSVSDEVYQFSSHPEYLASFQQSINTVRNLKCDILISAHPGFSDVFEKAEAKSFIDPNACRKYADDAEARLNKRLAEEASPVKPD
ncbi:MAG: subclass B3 metallo-beta-lactamase [Arenimonas sp.]|nr:subclass B3 metallo-beta-lactamase [Arenimonas sp.]